MISPVSDCGDVLHRLPEGFTQLHQLTELYLNDAFLDFLPGSFGRYVCTHGSTRSKVWSSMIAVDIVNSEIIHVH